MRFVSPARWLSPSHHAGPATAQKKDHSHGKESHFKVTPPADVKAAWTLITTKVSEAEKNLAAKQVEPIHEICRAS